jgi:hypothetical protein
MSTKKLPWLIAAIPLLAALHAGCGTSNGSTEGDDGGSDSGFVCPDGDTCAADGAILTDDGPTSDGSSNKK